MASSVKFYKAPKIQSIFSKFPWLLASFTLITFLALGLSQSDLHGYTSLLPARVLMFYEGINGWLQSTLSEVDKFETMRNEYLAACPEQPFRPHLFTTDPLVIYLENYISLAETQYLIELAKANYSESAFAKGNSPEKMIDPKIRSSTSSILPEDPIVACLERRSLDFQGFLPTSQIENLQTVKYETNEAFRPHYDWFAEPEENPRLSTIFGYLECDECVGGSTQFPNLGGRFSAKWCAFVDCESEDAAAADGIGFKPLVGNAVFWMNYYANGTGHPGVLHAGMPVRQGRKIGLNIMTRLYAGYS